MLRLLRLLRLLEGTAGELSEPYGHSALHLLPPPLLVTAAAAAEDILRMALGTILATSTIAKARQPFDRLKSLLPPGAARRWTGATGAIVLVCEALIAVWLLADITTGPALIAAGGLFVGFGIWGFVAVKANGEVECQCLGAVGRLRLTRGLAGLNVSLGAASFLFGVGGGTASSGSHIDAAVTAMSAACVGLVYWAAHYVAAVRSRTNEALASRTAL